MRAGSIPNVLWREFIHTVIDVPQEKNIVNEVVLVHLQLSELGLSPRMLKNQGRHFNPFEAVYGSCAPPLISEQLNTQLKGEVFHLSF
jgi:hypothetical protein